MIDKAMNVLYVVIFLFMIAAVVEAIR